MADLTTADISRTLRERLKEDGSWRVPNGKPARHFSKTDLIGLLLPPRILRQRVLLGGLLVLLLIGAALFVLLGNASPSTLASQVLEAPTRNPVSSAALPELWLTPVVASETGGPVDTQPTAGVALVERHPTPTPLPIPILIPAISAPHQPVGIPAVGAITTATEHLGNLTIDAQLTRAIAFGVEQRLEISARSDYAPMVGARVGFRITNSFGTSVQVAPDTDRSGRSTKVWQTYRSVGLNQVRVLVSAADGRELSAQLAFQGASSDD